MGGTPANGKTMTERTLLKEYFALCPDGMCRTDILTEAERRDIDVNGAMYLTGLVQRADAKNNNSRVYPYAILFREMESYKKPIKENRAVGGLDHTDSSVVELQHACIKFIDIWWEGKDVMGKMKVLSTPHGNTLRALVNDGVQVGISSRGLGSVREENGVLLVEDDFQLICFDIVSDPSTHGAFMKPKMVNEATIRDLGTMSKADRINRHIQNIISRHDERV